MHQTSPSPMTVMEARKSAKRERHLLRLSFGAERSARQLCESATRKAVDNFREQRKEFVNLRIEVRKWDKRMDDYEAEIALGEAVGFDVEQLCSAAALALRMRVRAALRVSQLRPEFLKRLADHRARVKSFREIRDSSIRSIRHERAKKHGDHTEIESNFADKYAPSSRRAGVRALVRRHSQQSCGG